MVKSILCDAIKSFGSQTFSLKSYGEARMESSTLLREQRETDRLSAFLKGTGQPQQTY